MKSVSDITITKKYITCKEIRGCIVSGVRKPMIIIGHYVNATKVKVSLVAVGNYSLNKQCSYEDTPTTCISKI
jgi:hypothetical protein